MFVHRPLDVICDCAFASVATDISTGKRTSALLWKNTVMSAFALPRQLADASMMKMLPVHQYRFLKISMFLYFTSVVQESKRSGF